MILAATSRAIAVGSSKTSVTGRASISGKASAEIRTASFCVVTIRSAPAFSASARKAALQQLHLQPGEQLLRSAIGNSTRARGLNTAHSAGSTAAEDTLCCAVQTAARAVQVSKATGGGAVALLQLSGCQGLLRDGMVQVEGEALQGDEL